MSSGPVELLAAERAIVAQLEGWGPLSRETCFEQVCVYGDGDPDAFRAALTVLEDAGRIRVRDRTVEQILEPVE